ncbi:putative cytochrome p450 [Phaeomoniella chlamydospora]|uniref:Putative cytochrome p450 n=1 Tax=Phaeomoniella chlamydospora TaxID=158046 RepID=A0A0G2DX41_PHACM|nr:putative cytochrome p450 [Phaeomoniella chlamydospora]
MQQKPDHVLVAMSFPGQSSVPFLIALGFSHPYRTLIILFICVCGITRWISGVKAQGDDFSSPVKRVKVTPYWIPVIGSAFNFAADSYRYIGRLGDKTRDGIVAINLGGATHHFILSPSLARTFFTKRSLSMKEMVYHAMENFFGDPGTLRTVSDDVLWGPIHRSLYGFMRDEFIHKGIDRVTEELRKRTPEFISFAKSEIDQHVWERPARVQLQRDGSAVVDLWPLSRNFVGDIASLVFMGQDFMDNNPDILRDLWTHDAKLNSFLIGLPRFFPGMGLAYAARERIRNALEQWNVALRTFQLGRDPGPEWSDMSDASDVMKLRNKAWFDNKAPTASIGPVNANSIIFFTIYHIITNPELYARIMTEISPYVYLTPGPNDLPIPDLPQLNIKGPELVRNTPLLKATMFECLRLDAHPFSYKKAIEDTTLTESEADAALLGKPFPQTYFIPKGSFVAISHGSIQMDPKYWDSPHEFRPERFLVTDPATGETKAEMGQLMSFGGGSTMCKGRKFAEKEIITFVASILGYWDFEPVDKTKGWPKVESYTMAGADYAKEYFVKMRRKKM